MKHFSFCNVAYGAVCALLSLTLTAKASGQEAYLYVTTAAGTYAYDASTAGKLTLIAGSPFHTTGAMIATNGSHFTTLGSGNLYSYAIESNGAIGSQVSTINITGYTGGDCYSPATPAPVELDHTGRYIYISLQNADCGALQTFEVASTGILTFKGAYTLGSGTTVTLPTLTGNDTVAAGLETTPSACTPYFAQWIKESDGVLDLAGGVFTVPTPQESDWYYMPLGPITDDPTDHLAVAMSQVEAPAFDCGTTGPTQLASYTANNSGGSVGFLTSNTYANMPTVPGGVSSMKLDPATGKLLAVATGTGVQLFHFNGANPITTFSGIIGTSGSILQLGWDNDGHLYALNSSGKMHVYNVTATSITETSGSPTVVPVGTFTVRTR